MPWRQKMRVRIADQNHIRMKRRQTGFRIVQLLKEPNHRHGYRSAKRYYAGRRQRAVRRADAPSSPRINGQLQRENALHAPGLRRQDFCQQTVQLQDIRKTKLAGRRLPQLRPDIGIFRRSQRQLLPGFRQKIGPIHSGKATKQRGTQPAVFTGLKSILTNLFHFANRTSR